MQDNNAPTPPPKLIWPRYAIAAVILAIVLAIAWMSYAIKQTREHNPWTPLPGQSTNN
jgi:hypothetical protein